MNGNLFTGNRLGKGLLAWIIFLGMSLAPVHGQAPVEESPPAAVDAPEVSADAPEAESPEATAEDEAPATAEDEAPATVEDEAPATVEDEAPATVEDEAPAEAGSQEPQAAEAPGAVPVPGEVPAPGGPDAAPGPEAPATVQEDEAPGETAPPAESSPVPDRESVKLPTLFVMDLTHSGLVEQELGPLQKRFREQLTETGKFKLLSATEAAKTLAALDIPTGGCREKECALRAGEALGADKVVTTNITNVTGTQWMISGVLVDVSRKIVEREIEMEHQGSVFELKGMPLTELATALSTPDWKPVAKEEVGPLRPPAPPVPPVAEVKKKDGKGGWPWWLWVLIGVGAAGLAAGGGGGGGDGGGGGGGGGGATGGVTVTW